MLFAELFFGLRQAGLKIGLGEWMALLETLKAGLVKPDLSDFYHVARAVLIKNESHYDLWDQVFMSVFGGLESVRPSIERFLDWLKQPQALGQLTPEQLAALAELPLDRLRELFEQRLRAQKERHDGGNRWIGTGGTSPFGNGGAHPGGVRVGGSGGNRSAVQIAGERRFRDYRDDLILDDRSIAVALKRLRRLGRTGVEPELDVDESIDQTCRNAGELVLEFRPPRRNQARVLLLMDTGGSMDPYAELVEKLFSTASQLNHWKQFNAYSFHNCVYEKLYTRIAEEKGVATAEVLQSYVPETALIMVGDAYMAPSELVQRYGAIDYDYQNLTPGIVWLHRLRTRFSHAVWLNPLREAHWPMGFTIRTIGNLFPMFPLTLAGLERAVDYLLKATPAPLPELDPRWQ
jgi:uncharacterized protein with von Willebrand factor type A (vWA) domain